MGTLTVLGNFLIGVGVVLVGIAALYYVYSHDTSDK